MARIGRTYSNRPSNIILPSSYSLSQQTLKTWKQALESALASEDPSRLEYLEVCNSILLDNNLASIIETRVLKVLRSKFRLVDANGKENTDLLALFQQPWFEEFLKHAMWSKFKGTTVIELWDLDENMQLDNCSLIPRENCNFLKGFFTKETGEDNGTAYKEGAFAPYYIQVGGDRDLGLLKDVAPAAISKKYAVASWLELVEKFGIPPRTVTTDSYSNTRHQELASMMAQMVSSHYAVLQGNEKLEVLNGINGDPHQVFDSLIIRLNSEQNKRVLGHDSASGTTDAKGTYGSMQILQDVANDRHESDKTFIKYLINKELIPRLLLISPAYSVLKNFTFDWDNFKDLSAVDLIDAVGKLATAGYITDPKHITDKTGIPILCLKEESNPSDENGKKKKPNLTALHKELVTAYHFVGPGENFEANADLEKEFNEFARSIYYDKNAVKTPFKFYLNIAETFAEALANELTVKASANIESAFYAQLKNNLFVFSAAKTFTQYQELSALLTDENGKKRNWQSFKDEALKIHKTYNLTYLKTEYVTASRTALMAGKWQQFERLKDLYDLMYDTAEDSKVRPDHAKLHGIVKAVDDAFWNTHTPLLDFGCRCGLRQVAKGTKSTNTTDPKDYPKVPKAFRFNAGKEQLIFSNEHPYIKNLDKNSKRELQAVKDYGLPEVSKIYARGKGISPSITEFKTKESAAAWFTKTKELSATIGKTKHKISFPEKQYNHIVDDNKNERWKWINQIPAVLKSANEVYLVNYKNKIPTYRFIKYYESHKLAVNVEIGEEMLIRTAYEITNDNSERQGMLMMVK
jgi:SPP1 gp7 family putative phage head morphogenesis protein